MRLVFESYEASYFAKKYTLKSKRYCCGITAKIFVFCTAPDAATPRVPYRRTPTRVPYSRMDYTCALQTGELHVGITDRRRTVYITA